MKTQNHRTGTPTHEILTVGLERKEVEVMNFRLQALYQLFLGLKITIRNRSPFLWPKDTTPQNKIGPYPEQVKANQHYQ